MMAELAGAIEIFHAADLAENVRREMIIWRELANHEAQMTLDITSTADALEGYGIIREEVAAEWDAYLRHCVENDFF